MNALASPDHGQRRHDNGGPGDANRPGDLGYWVGYRIVKSYYQHAADKHRALRDIYAMTDPKAFVAKSDWHPGD